MMSLSLSPAMGQAPAGSSAAPPVNPNLLTWTEAFQNGAWVKTSASVLADFDVSPSGSVDADQITNAAVSSTVAQTSTTAAATGAAVTAGFGLTTSWLRYSVTGVFNTGTFTFSVWLLGGPGDAINLRIEAAGGFIKCSLRDGGDQIAYLAWGAKLETGATATGDVLTYGSRTT